MSKFYGLFNNQFRLSMKSQYFKRNFIIILLVTAIPGIISSIAIYYFGVGKVEDKLRETHENQINEQMKNINDQFYYLEESMSYWAFEPRFNSSILDIDFKKDFLETRDIMRNLLIFQGSHPLIKQVNLFVDTNEPVLFNPYYQLIQKDSEIDFYRSIMTDQKTVNWNRVLDFEESSDQFSLILTHNIPGDSRIPFGTIVVTIDYEKLAQLLQVNTGHDNGVTFLINEENKLLVTSNNKNSSEFLVALRDKALQQENQGDSFPLKWEGETYSVTFGEMERIGSEWKYISAAPTKSITAPIIFISRLILNISLLVLGIAIIMTWFVSNNIYRPLNKLIQTLINKEKESWSHHNKDEFELIKERWSHLTDKSEDLQKQLITQIPQLKYNFLMQLRNGYLSNHTEEDLYNKMENYGWEIKQKSFMVLDTQLTGAYEAEITTEKDEMLFTFAVANIMDELAQKYFGQFTILNYYDLSVSMFLVLEESEGLKEKLLSFSKEITAAINKILHLKVTITLSERTDQIKQIPFIFNQVSQGKLYRDFENKNQLIDLSQINIESATKKNKYPFETEKKIIQSIRRGYINETEQLVREFLKELTEDENKEIHIQQGMIQLLSTIQHEIIRSGIQPSELYDDNNMMEKLTQIREIEWMVRWVIDKVIAPYIQILESRMDIEMKTLVENTKEYINNNYMREDLSLETCADIEGISSYTLSKAFNNILNINFIDYLTNIRIEKAKDLLLNTDKKIGEISEDVGYQRSYFNRVFKRQVGITPSQYRKKR